MILNIFTNDENIEIGTDSYHEYSNWVTSSSNVVLAPGETIDGYLLIRSDIRATLADGPFKVNVPTVSLRFNTTDTPR